MRSVKYYVANSLDNYIARADGSVDWLFMEGDYGMAEFFKSIDTVLIGRKTYEFALEHRPKPKKPRASPSRPKRRPRRGPKSYVFSRTMSEAPDDDVTIVSENASSVVRSLKETDGRDIWLMGGGELAASLFAEDLVDEILLAVHPVLLGSGVPLFPALGAQIDLELTACRSHPNGVVQLAYRVRG